MDVTSYLLGKKSSGGGGGGATRDWSKVGYEETPTTLDDGYDYAKQIYDNWDASVSDRSSQFNNNYDLVVFPNVDFSNVTNASGMFYNCNRLTTVPQDLLADVRYINGYNMFYNCYGLKEIGDVNATGKESMFNNCKSLYRVNSVTFDYGDKGIFQNCIRLEEIGEIKTRTTSVSRNNAMFTNCSSLSNDTLRKILVFLKKLTNQGSDGKRLNFFGLSSTQAELCTTFDEWQDLANAGWTTGY